MEEIEKLTPMMEQWKACKLKAKEAILLFRMGDFYEAFFEDAEKISEVLDLTLTKRQNIPMSGVPWHTCDGYIDRLIAKGFKIAIAEQIEDPKQAKGLVKRDIVRFITPGTVIHSSLMSDATHNFILSLTRVGSVFGLASIDIGTGLFQVIEIEDEKELLNELYRLKAAEIVVSKKFIEKHPTLFSEIDPALISTYEEWHFDHKMAYAYLISHFQVSHLDRFGLNGLVSAINAAGALLAYVHEELSIPVQHLKEIKLYSIQDILLLDRTCQRNLELTESLQDGSRKHTLLSVIDYTQTAMGGRLIRQWLKKPLLSLQEILKRQEAIQTLLFAPELRSRLMQELKQIRDLERLVTKVSSGYCSPRDLVQLSNSLEKVAPLRDLTQNVTSSLLAGCRERMADFTKVVAHLKRALVEEPPLRLTEGEIFRDGYHAQLDELRQLTRGGKEWLSNYQTQIREETGIKNLKVSYNRIFGYYIEVSRGQASAMPAHFHRRQTLANAERFISDPLKEYEEKVLSSEEKIQSLEYKLFQELREEILRYQASIFTTAQAIAELDTLLSLAEAANKHHFSKPVVDLGNKLDIKGGRHPVIAALRGQLDFIPNDTLLNGDEKHLMLITGPNMAGKSTYMRQVALIVILAQMGSFVPATDAHIGIVDRIFTRIGASDDLSRGQSTFMVEMHETANILNNATSKSLVILDEIGRGTSTYDGVSIAWAVAEYLLSKQIKTLFATHYWELTELEKSFSGAVNYHAAVLEEKDQIVFMHKIMRGGADRSYGIHVARLAGLPSHVVQKADLILKRLETRKKQGKKEAAEDSQLMLF